MVVPDPVCFVKNGAGTGHIADNDAFCSGNFFDAVVLQLNVTHGFKVFLQTATKVWFFFDAISEAVAVLQHESLANSN